MIKAVVNFFQGKKSYIVAFLAAVYAVLSVYFGKMDLAQAAMWLFGSGALVSLKSALSKLEK